MWRCTVFLCPIFFFLLLCCKFFWIFCFCFVFIFFCSCPLVVFIFIFLPPSLFIIFYGQLVNFYDRCIEYHFRRSTTPTMMYRHKVVFFFFFYFFLYMSKKKKTRLNFLGLTKLEVTCDLWRGIAWKVCRVCMTSGQDFKSKQYEEARATFTRRRSRSA